ncbi:hypothetical protein RND81_10G053900 [Saponaria officinalis]|uniref:Uncharacterized protein n=1 Tax=Saponaria officinalis TaxID=3572 RepID=A0AAW1HZK7_SAPOF
MFDDDLDRSSDYHDSLGIGIDGEVDGEMQISRNSHKGETEVLADSTRGVELQGSDNICEIPSEMASIDNRALVPVTTVKVARSNSEMGELVKGDQVVDVPASNGKGKAFSDPRLADAPATALLTVNQAGDYLRSLALRPRRSGECGFAMKVDDAEVSSSSDESVGSSKGVAEVDLNKPPKVP